MGVIYVIYGSAKKYDLTLFSNNYLTVYNQENQFQSIILLAAWNQHAICKHAVWVMTKEA